MMWLRLHRLAHRLGWRRPDWLCYKAGHVIATLPPQAPRRKP